MSDGTWTLAGLDLRADDVTLSPTSITLAGLIPRGDVDTWEETVGDRAGDLQEVQRAGGQVRVEPTDGGSTLTLETAPIFDPPEPASQEVLVESFELQETTVEKRRVSVTLRRTSLPDSGGTVDEQGGDWALDLGDHAVVALPTEAVGQVRKQGETVDPSVSVTVRLTATEADAIRQTGLVRGVDIRSVPDGVGTARDTAGGHQTTGVAAPITASVPQGDYLLRGWSLTRPHQSRRPFRAQLDLVPLATIGLYVGPNQDITVDSCPTVDGLLVRGGITIDCITIN